MFGAVPLHAPSLEGLVSNCDSPSTQLTPCVRWGRGASCSCLSPLCHPPLDVRICKSYKYFAMNALAGQAAYLEECVLSAKVVGQQSPIQADVALLSGITKFVQAHVYTVMHFKGESFNCAIRSFHSALPVTMVFAPLFSKMAVVTRRSFLDLRCQEHNTRQFPC